MRPAPSLRLLFIPLCAATLVSAFAATQLPVVNGKPTVATVNDDPITLGELELEIASMHAMQPEGAQRVRHQNPSVLLERLITARLVTQEARNIGLDDDPDGKAAFARMKLELARDLLTERALAPVKADPAAVESIFRNMVREYRVRALLVPNATDAQDLATKAQAGGDFDKLATALVAAKKAQEEDSSQFLKSSQLLPQVGAALTKMKAGAVGPAIKIGGSWTVFKLLEMRYPENAEARARAQEVALNEARGAALAAYVATLRAKYATVDTKMLAGLDFDAPGGFDKLSRDQRPLAQVKGEAPVTVADLAAGMHQRFYHGVEQAVAVKRVNKQKESVLQDVLNRRVIATEAARSGLTKSVEYKEKLVHREQAYLFDAFVKKAIVPDIKIEDADVKAYYKAHLADFTGPEMMKLEALAFVERKDAEDALAKLQRGADFAWTKTNARGQADPAKQRVMEFPPTPIVAHALPEGARKALAGAREGDYRFYAEEKGPYYVLHLKGYTAAQPAALEEVREGISKRLFGDKVGASLQDWGVKLRKASNVKVFATGDDLLKLVMRDMAAGG